jgi:hypothetical protein
MDDKGGNVTEETKAIVRLLNERHKMDIGYPEVPTRGSRRAAGSTSFDYYAVKPNFADFRCTGYEVKVSRKDFLVDAKVPKLLPYCHELYYVAPAKLLKPEELAQDVGLIEVASTGSKLLIKKKAPTRPVQIPDTIMLFLLMQRTEKAGCRESLRDAMDGRMERKRFGLEMGKGMWKVLRQTETEIRNAHLAMSQDRRVLEMEKAKLDRDKRAIETRLEQLKALKDIRQIAEKVGIAYSALKDIADQV